MFEYRVDTWEVFGVFMEFVQLEAGPDAGEDPVGGESEGDFAGLLEVL